MKVENKNRLEVISNLNLQQFREQVNQFLDSHKVTSVNYAKDGGEYTAFISFIQEVKTAEDIRDEYNLSGEVYYCKDCPKWGSNYTDEPRGTYICHAKVTKKTLRGCTPACLFFYEKLARGEIKPYE